MMKLPQYGQSQPEQSQTSNRTTTRKNLPIKPKHTQPRPLESFHQKAPSVIMPRTYALIISSYENVIKNDELPDAAANQLSRAIGTRLSELNHNAIQQLEQLPEFEKLGLANLGELSEELPDMLAEPETSGVALDLLKNSKFAELMESTESVHLSFADMMKRHGEEKLMFGMLDTVNIVSQPKPKGLTIKA